MPFQWRHTVSGRKLERLSRSRLKDVLRKALLFRLSECQVNEAIAKPNRRSVTSFLLRFAECQAKEAIAKPTRRSASGFRNDSEPALPVRKLTDLPRGGGRYEFWGARDSASEPFAMASKARPTSASRDCDRNPL